MTDDYDKYRREEERLSAERQADAVARETRARQERERLRVRDDAAIERLADADHLHKKWLAAHPGGSEADYNTYCRQCYEWGELAERSNSDWAEWERNEQAAWQQAHPLSADELAAWQQAHPAPAEHRCPRCGTTEREKYRKPLGTSIQIALVCGHTIFEKPPQESR
jgi:hypothetical protein